MMPAPRNDELLVERRRSEVSSQELSTILYKSEANLRRLKRLWNAVEGDPAFSKKSRPWQNHEERYVNACAKLKRLVELKVELGVQSLEEMYDLYLAVDESLPIDVHLSMFLPLMRQHTNKEQRQLWLQRALDFEIIGAYAQTEIGHGSNVRGIETTATFEAETDSFVINSPTQTSTKWWPGGLAHTANYAVVYANLIIGTKNFGPHGFMVNIRCEDTHEKLPGVICGDIGAKLGYNSMDNGFARFNNVRIPRFNMLAGFAQVSREGVYKKENGAEKVNFGIMLGVRVRLVANSSYVLARVLCIAIRYSCVRRQGQIGSKNKAEMQVIDYPTQQRVLMPLLGLAWALHFVGEMMQKRYDDYLAAAAAPSLALLPDLHLMSSGLKALITIKVADGMEAARKCCGGHGFLINAGFHEIITSYLPMCTLEGTREVLGLQCGKSLLKTFVKSKGGESSLGGGSSTAYFGLGKRDEIWSSRDYLSAQIKAGNFTLLTLGPFLLDIFSRRAKYLVVEVLKTIDLSDESSLLASSVEIVKAAEAHSELLIVKSNLDGLATLPASTSRASSSCLAQLALLFSFSLIELSAGDFITSGLLSTMDVTNVSNDAKRLGKLLRLDAVNLIESWQFSDERLASTLGSSSGNYADALFEEALREPMNQKPISDGYVHLKHVLSRKKFAHSRL